MYVEVYAVYVNNSESTVYLEKNNVWLVETDQMIYILSIFPGLC